MPHPALFTYLQKEYSTIDYRKIDQLQSLPLQDEKKESGRPAKGIIVGKMYDDLLSADFIFCWSLGERG
jgi:hypothetical protein